MRTVKEISDLTGISVRTLHYYDEIGLLKPTDKSEAGYRLYDDKALETLQQILFFREIDISLKEIKAVIENPALEKNQILQMQRKMLVAKKERMERLITSIDRILKGDNTMDFEVFTKIELEDMYNSMAANMSEEQKAIFIENYGSMEEWKKKFLEDPSTEAVQKNFQKIVEWYGSKEKALDASKNPGNTEIFPAYQKQMEEIVKKLAGKKGQDVNSFEVKEYRTNKEIQAVQDSIYGEGTTEFIGQVIEAFYSKK